MQPQVVSAGRVTVALIRKKKTQYFELIFYQLGGSSIIRTTSSDRQIHPKYELPNFTISQIQRARIILLCSHESQ